MSLFMLAIDIGKLSFHVHGVDADGVIVSRKVCRSSRFQSASVYPAFQAHRLSSYGSDSGGISRK